MRSAGNFHPQWGYLAPAPSFLRSARIVVVAAAVGATAGAAVVVSLLERPGADAETSIAARALVTGTAVAATPATPSSKAVEAAAAPVPATTSAAISPSSAPSPPPAPHAAARSKSKSASKSESKPATAAGRSAGRRHRTASNRWQGENFWRKRRWRDNGRLFSSRAGFSEDDPN